MARINLPIAVHHKLVLVLPRFQTQRGFPIASTFRFFQVLRLPIIEVTSHLHFLCLRRIKTKCGFGDGRYCLFGSWCHSLSLVKSILQSFSNKTLTIKSNRQRCQHKRSSYQSIGHPHAITSTDNQNLKIKPTSHDTRRILSTSPR